MLPCQVCQSAMKQRIEQYLYECQSCGFWRSALQAGSTSVSAGDLVAGREEAFRGLRRANYSVLLDVVQKHQKLAGSRLLDVGCAQGWFVEAARQRGMQATGIESEPEVCKQARLDGLDIVVGTFPEQLSVNEPFDIIAFNDVLEHLDDPAQVLEHTRRFLKPGGWLILNVPNSEGAIFRTATLLRLRGILRRLWQADFYSPHISYFNESNLGRLAQSKGFVVQERVRLKTVLRQGLWQRLSLTPSSMPSKVMHYGAACVMAPLLNYVLPADTLAVLFRRAV